MVMSRILMIEDEADLRLLYRLLLEDEGFEIIDAGSATEALQALSRHKIDAVVLDLALPDLDGLQLMSAILALQPDLPIVINTAYQYRSEDFHCWGAEAFVVKSSDISELKHALSRVTTSPDEVEKIVLANGKSH